MPDTLTSRVARLYADPTTRLVFPSQAVADGWARRLIYTGHVRSVRSDRLISWDRFKELLVPIRKRTAPITQAQRLYFIRLLVQENRRELFFQTLIMPRYASEGWTQAGGLARLLPSLWGLVRDDRITGAEATADYRRLFERYQQFLKAQELFEPTWVLEQTLTDGSLTIRALADGKRPVVFAPEVLEDYPQLQSALAGNVETVPVEELFGEADSAEATTATQGDRQLGLTPGGNQAVSADGAAPAQVFSDVHREVRWVFTEIDRLLERGTPPHQIALSVAQLDQYRPVIATTARLFSVPIRLAAGLPLASQPVGRMFRQIDAVLQSDYAVSDLSPLLLDRAVPWKAPEELRDLIRFGYEGHAHNRTEWKAAFSLCPDRDRAERVAARFQQLRSGLEGIRRAQGPGELRRAIRRFFDREVDTGGHDWSAEAERIYERVQVLLSDLERALSGLSQPIDQEDPNPAEGNSAWAIFMRMLQEQRYVPAGTNGMVSVYDYRVAAGMGVEHHFVLNLSQTATRVTGSLPFGLSEADPVAVQFKSNDRSAPFLGLYRSSGRIVRRSCARRVFGSVQTPAAEIDDWQEEPDLQAQPDLQEQSALADQPYEREVRWWAGETDTYPDRVFHVQRRGFDFQRRSLFAAATGSIQYDRPIPEHVRPFIKLPSHVSVTGLPLFLHCPFGFLLQNAFGLQEEVWSFADDDRMALGTALHAVLKDYYNVPPKERPSEPDLLTQLVKRHLNRRRLRWSSARLAWDARLELWTVRLRRLIDELDRIFGPGGGHLEHSVDEPLFGVPLSGRIDRILVDQAEGVFSVLDYKSGSGPNKKDVLGDRTGSPEEISEFQLPVYMLLWNDSTGMDPAGLYYGSIKDGRITKIAIADTEDWEAVELICERLRTILPEQWDRFSNYDVRNSRGRDCLACPAILAPVLRSCFVVRGRYGT